MEKLIIRGNRPLRGEVTISGAKNAALGILPACILSDEKCKIENLPNIKDIQNYISILTRLGAEVDMLSNGRTCIDAQNQL